MIEDTAAKNDRRELAAVRISHMPRRPFGFFEVLSERHLAHTRSALLDRIYEPIALAGTEASA